MKPTYLSTPDMVRFTELSCSNNPLRKYPDPRGPSGLSKNCTDAAQKYKVATNITMIISNTFAGSFIIQIDQDKV